MKRKVTKGLHNAEIDLQLISAISITLKKTIPQKLLCQRRRMKGRGKRTVKICFFDLFNFGFHCHDRVNQNIN